MRDEAKWRAELEELLSAAELGALDAAQSARLNDLLREDDAALDALVETLEVDALLRWHHGVARPEVRAARRPRLLRVAALAAAAAALFAIAYVNWDVQTPVETPPPSATHYEVAQVGNWELESHSDAQFEIVSPSVVRLARGELLVRSLGDAPGALEIETPDGLVRAQGTEFYVGAHKTSGGLFPMKRLTRVLVLSGTVALTNSLGAATATRGEFLVAEEDFAPVAVVAEANNSFGIDLYKEFAQAGGENVFFSPYSISLALAMTLEGARGETATELARALHIPTLMRRIGDGSQRLPFAMSDFHTGHRALTRMLEDAQTNSTQLAMRGRRSELLPLIADFEQRIDALSDRGKINEANELRREVRGPIKELAQLDEEIDSYLVSISNALFGERTYPFAADYLQTIAGSYGTGSLRTVDFVNHPDRERRLINDWVSDETNGLIEQLIAPDLISNETRLALVNAIYFRGNWSEPFKPRWTREKEFTLTNGRSILTRMMSGSKSRARYGAFESDGSLFNTPEEIRTGQTTGLYPSDEGFEVLELPYQGGDLSMVLFLPRTHAGLVPLEQRLTSKNVARWIEDLEQREVRVKLPAFESGASFSLRETLEKLGVQRAFTNPLEPRGANFSGMTATERPEEQLYISAVIHQATIRVDETGTEASAATAVTALRSGASHQDVMPFTPEFNANRPFAYAIRDKNTGTLLFLGRFVNPE